MAWAEQVQVQALVEERQVYQNQLASIRLAEVIQPKIKASKELEQ